MYKWKLVRSQLSTVRQAGARGRAGSEAKSLDYGKLFPKRTAGKQDLLSDDGEALFLFPSFFKTQKMKNNKNNNSK